MYDRTVFQDFPRIRSRHIYRLDGDIRSATTHREFVADWICRRSDIKCVGKLAVVKKRVQCLPRTTEIESGVFECIGIAVLVDRLKGESRLVNRRIHRSLSSRQLAVVETHRLYPVDFLAASDRKLAGCGRGIIVERILKLCII